jgi:integrase
MAPEEFKRLLDATDNPKHKLIWRLLAGCGLRSNELVTLKVKDIDLERRIISLAKSNTKSGKSRRVVIPKSLLADLSAFIKNKEPEDYLFVGQSLKDGKLQPLTTRAIRKAFSLACEKASLGNYSPHSLRHYCAEQMVDAEIDLNTIRLQLGHSSLGITQIYLSNNLEKRKDRLDSSGFVV